VSSLPFLYLLLVRPTTVTIFVAKKYEELETDLPAVEVPGSGTECKYDVHELPQTTVYTALYASDSATIKTN